MSGYSGLRDLGVTFRPFDGAPPPQGGRPTPFSAPWSATVELLADELRHLKAARIVVELGLEERDLRVDGLPRANARMTTDAVRISFESKWGALRYETGEFSATYWREGAGWQANIRAIALAMEALRKVDRYGVSKRGEQYRGWRALPTGTDPADAIATPEQARAFLGQWDGDWKAAAKATHPDLGGDTTEYPQGHAREGARRSMSDQLTLLGGETPTEPKLTDRQRFALAFVRSAARTGEGVQGDELGAALHERRRAEGGKGHDAGTRCRFCADEGRDMARSLIAKGLVERHPRGGFRIAGAGEERSQGTAYDPKTAAIPY